MVDLPTKMNKSVRRSSDSLNLSLLVILARSRRQSELLFDSHSWNDLLSHAPSWEIIVPIVAVNQHHNHVQEDE